MKTKVKPAFISPGLIFLPVVIYLAFFLPPLLHRIGSALVFPFQLDGEEGFLLNQVLRLLNGEPIYKPLDSYPYMVANYPPLYIVLNALFAPGDMPTLFTGRLISACACLAIAILMFTIVYYKSADFFVALLAPFFLLITYDNYEWIAFYRVDYLAIYFSLSGLCLIVIHEQSWGAKAGALLFFWAGVYTKQIELCAPLACCLYLIIKEKQRAWPFLVSFFAGALLIFLLLNVITKGQYFYHIVIYNINKFDLWQLGHMLLHVWRFNKFFLLAVTLCLLAYLAGWLKTKASGHEYGPIFIYFLFTNLFLLAVGKQGAATNYFLEPYIGLSLFFCISLGILTRNLREPTHRMRNIMLLGLLFLLMVAHCLNLGVKKPLLFYAPNPTVEDYFRREKIIKIIQATEGPVLNEHPVLNILAGKQVLFQPFIMSQLAKEGKWDESQFLQAIKEKQFALVITTQDLFEEQFFFRYTDGMINALRQAYEPYRQFEQGKGVKFFVYRPIKALPPIGIIAKN